MKKYAYWAIIMLGFTGNSVAATLFMIEFYYIDPAILRKALIFAGNLFFTGFLFWAMVSK